jgi:AcrR family transcriptional regulator
MEAPRETILSQAAILFAEHGYEGTSLQEVAAAVGITKAAVYHYFPTKQVMYEAIVVDILERLDSHVRTSVEGVAGHRERLRQIMLSHADFFEANYTAFVTLIHGISGLSRPVSEAETAVRDRYEGLVRDAVRAGKKSGDLKVTHPDVAARAVLSMLNWMSRWYRPSGSKRAREFADEYFSIVYDGLRPR